MAFNRNRATPVPRPGPAGGVFYVVPMGGSELKKLARKMTVITYVKDKGKTIFNQKGQAVPQFDTDEDVIVAEATKRCPRIENATEAVYDAEGKVIGETPIVDPRAQAAGFPDGTIIDAVIIAEIMALLVDVEREVEVEVKDEEEDSGDTKPETTAESDTPTAEAKPKKKRKVKVTMMHAEWLLGESAEIGQSKAATELGNS
jgi:hypothetical protein